MYIVIAIMIGWLLLFSNHSQSIYQNINQYFEPDFTLTKAMQPWISCGLIFIVLSLGTTTEQRGIFFGSIMIAAALALSLRLVPIFRGGFIMHAVDQLFSHLFASKQVDDKPLKKFILLLLVTGTIMIIPIAGPDTDIFFNWISIMVVGYSLSVRRSSKANNDHKNALDEISS